MKNLRLVLPAALILALAIGAWSPVAAGERVPGKLVPAKGAPAQPDPGRGTDGAADKPAGKQPSPNTLAGMPDDPDPVEYESAEGHFQVTYPSGCARMMTHNNVVPDSVTATRIFMANCDRKGVENEGCSVIARIGDARNLKGKAAADRVIAAMMAQLKGFGAQPFKQTPFKRDFGARGVCEGLDIKARKVNGPGDFWIRGVLHGDDIYLVIAWKASGDLWTNMQYAVFFDSFRPWTN